MRVEEELTEEELQALAEAQDEAETDEEEQEEEARVAEVLPAALRRYGAAVAAIRQIVAGQAVDLEGLVELSDEEREALETLQEVVKGMDGDRFMLAEDRLQSLNQTLAVLQPALGVATYGTVMDELRDSFDSVIDEINALRDHLEGLDIAEEMQEHRQGEQATDAEVDDGDKPADAGEAEKKDAKKKKKPVPAYDPGAPDVPDAPRPPPTAYDPTAPELPPEPPPPPSAYDPAAPEPAPGPPAPPSVYEPEA